MFKLITRFAQKLDKLGKILTYFAGIDGKLQSTEITMLLDMTNFLSKKNVQRLLSKTEIENFVEICVLFDEGQDGKLNKDEQGNLYNFMLLFDQGAAKGLDAHAY